MLPAPYVEAIYLGPVLEIDPKTDKPRIKKKRTLDEDKQWITVEVFVTVPGLHRIRLNGEEHESESRWCTIAPSPGSRSGTI